MSSTGKAVTPFRIAALHRRVSTSDKKRTGACISDKERVMFLEKLAATGRFAESAMHAGHSYVTFRALVDHDESFREMAQHAQEHFADTLEAEARRRAQEGVERGVYYKGDLVATEREYSDRLMELLLKGHRREKFGDKVDVSAKISAGVLVVPAVAVNSDEWQRQYQEQSLGNVIDGEAREVKEVQR